MKFKVGDKVRIIVDCSNYAVKEKNGGLGMVGEIIRYGELIYVSSPQFINPDKTWCFCEDQLEFVDGDQQLSTQFVNFRCQRCNNFLVSKLAQDPFTGQTYNINKCLNCGWC